MERGEEDDERREASIASAASLRPNFKPKSSLTPSQLSKFQVPVIKSERETKLLMAVRVPKQKHLLHWSADLRKELHRRRLQIKARSKMKKKPKGLVDSIGKSHEKDINCKECTDENLSKSVVNSRIPSPENSLGHTSPSEKGKVAANKASKERQKLHWGLDAKERWERKSNM